MTKPSNGLGIVGVLGATVFLLIVAVLLMAARPVEGQEPRLNRLAPAVRRRPAH